MQGVQAQTSIVAHMWCMACLQATQGSQAGLVGNLQGMWCDAVPALVYLEWQAGRQAIWQPPPASTAAAVQAWLQVLPLPPVPLCTLCDRLWLCWNMGHNLEQPHQAQTRPSNRRDNSCRFASHC